MRRLLAFSIPILIGLSAAGQNLVFTYDPTGNRDHQIQAITNPSIVLEGDTAVCVADSLTLTASGGVSYLWSTGDTDSVISFSLLDTLPVKVIATAANGCVDSLEKTLIAYPVPEGYSLAGDTLPVADSLSVSTYSVPSEVGSFYDWSVSGGVLTSGFGTSTIQVIWTTDSLGELRLIETNVFGCVGDTLRLPIEAGVEQTVPLESGWNLFSTYVKPLDAQIPISMGSLTGQLTQVKDLQSFYDPLNPLSPLQNLADGQGYWVNLNAADTFYLKGRKIRLSSTPIILFPGWNLIGYLPISGQSPADALTDISPYLVQVKSVLEVYDPSLPPVLNTLTELTPGQGYWVRIDSAAPTPLSFVYPDPGSTEWHTSQPSMDLLTDLDLKRAPNSTVAYGRVRFQNESLEGEGIIKVFAGDLLVGLGQVVDHEQESLVTLVIQGEVTKELTFILDYQGDTYESVFKTMSDPGQTIPGFLPLDFAPIGTGIGGASMGRFTLQPNPAQGAVRLTWSLPSPGPLTIRLLSPTGQIIRTLYHEDYVPGSGSFEFEVDLPTGLYGIEIQSGSGKRLEKLMIR